MPDPVTPPSPNDCGPRDSRQSYRLPEAIYKPLGGNLDDRGNATAATHQDMPNKVLPSARVAPPAREIQAPAYTSGKPSKPSGRPLPTMSTGRR